MSEITLGLRMGAKLWDSSTDELPRMTSHSRWLMNAAADEIDRLTTLSPPEPTEASRIADALGRWMATTIDQTNKHEWHRDMNAAIAALRALSQRDRAK